MLVAAPTSLPEQVTQVLTRALTNLLPGDKTWAAQKCTTWDPDTGTVETTPLTPKAKPAAAGSGVPLSKPDPRRQPRCIQASPRQGSSQPRTNTEPPLRKLQSGMLQTGQLHSASGIPRSTGSGPKRTRMQPSSPPLRKGVSSNNLSRRLPDDKPCRQTTSSG
jgi:hypothetical protein